MFFCVLMALINMKHFDKFVVLIQLSRYAAISRTIKSCISFWAFFLSLNYAQILT